MNVKVIMDSLPGDVRRRVLLTAYKGMSIDQRRAAGMMPDRLVLPQPFVDKLQSRPKVWHVSCSGIYECALVTLPLPKKGIMDWSSYTMRVTVWPARVELPAKVQRMCLKCHNECCADLSEW